MTKKAPLQNEFRWSVSRQSCFDECQKKYWYTYYGSWDGWPVNGFDPNRKVAPLAALLYRLKQIQSLPLFIGSVVHETIEETLKKYHKNLPSLETIQNDAKRRFFKGIEDAKEKRWTKHPKKFHNLLEWYYHKNIPTDDELQKYSDKIEQMLASWYSSQAITQVILASQSQWMGIEQIIEFKIQDVVPLIVVIDFMLIWPTSQGDIFIIFDWKTGGERAENIEQLYAYAISINRQYKHPIEKVIISPFYLSQGPAGYKKIGYNQTDKLDLTVAQEIEKKILTQGSQLLAIHNEKASDPLNFPYTHDRAKCLSCPFVEVCEKAQYEPKSKDDLAQLI